MDENIYMKNTQFSIEKSSIILLNRTLKALTSIMMYIILFLDKLSCIYVYIICIIYMYIVVYTYVNMYLQFRLYYNFDLKVAALCKCNQYWLGSMELKINSIRLYIKVCLFFDITSSYTFGSSFFLKTSSLELQVPEIKAHFYLHCILH